MNEEEKNKKKVKEKKKRTPLQRIVNAFLYTGIGLLILFLILLGITQTSTFREFLRETIIEEANSSLNGKLYIERIDGTIFTSLLLHNTVVTMEKDTLLYAEKIGVMTSPLQLLLKKIFIRHFEIENASIKLTRDETGELNLAKLFPPSEDTDTTTSEFPFVIQLANLEFENINFSFRDYSVNRSSSYEEMNFNDLAINNLNLNLNAVIDINNNIYEMSLDHLSFKTNIKGFNINEFEGEFFLNENNIIAQDLYLKTDRSEVMINASAKNINIFDTTGINIEKANLNLVAGSQEFSFYDLRPFAPSLNMLQGKIEFGLNASGTMKRLNLNSIQVSLENSRVEGNGELKNLLDENLLISADLSGSFIDQKDIQNLIAGMEIPVYPEYGVIRFDTLTYNGNPLDFKSGVNIQTDKGNIAGLINLNLQNELIQYDLNLKTSKVDLEPLAGINSSLNISADIKGMGTTPETFDGSVKLFANGSSINGNSIDTLWLTADAVEKFINYDFHLVSNKTVADLNGNIDFNPEEPAYHIKGSLTNLNLAEFVQDSTLETNFNLTLDVDGNGFNQDSIDLFLIATLHNSDFNDIKIDTTRLIVDIRSDPGDRVINIISDLADVTVMGDFKVDQAVDLILSEVEMVSTAFAGKVNYIFPSMVEDEAENQGIKIKEPLFTKVDGPLSINFLIDLKDFSLLSAFLGNYNLDVDAEIGGGFESTADGNVLFTFDTDLRHVKLYNDDEAYFISNMMLDLKVMNNFNAVSTSDLTLNFDITSEHILVNSEIYDLDFSIDMENDIAGVNLSANPEPYFAEFIAELDLSRNKIDASIDSLTFVYEEFEIRNRNNLNLSYDGNRLDINQFKLFHENSELSIKGYLSQAGEQDLDINLKNWRGKDLSVNLMGIRPENSIEASINLDANINGSVNSPVINANLLIDSISYGSKKFGELNSTIKYNNKNLDINLAFLDSTLNKNDTALTITGYVPIDLTFSGAEENYMETKPLRINLRSNGFNLGAFGDILPAVNRLRGEFTSNLSITGTPSSLTTNGYLKIVDAAFFLEANNLEYNASMLINIDGEDLKLDSLVIANIKGTENGGRMIGSGTATLNNFEVTSSRFSFSGDLKVLSEESKSVSPSIYGELVIGTEGNVEISIEDNRIFVQAPVLIKNADLTFPQTQSAYQSGSENYIYKFAAVTTVPDEESGELGFKKLVEISEKGGRAAQRSKSKTSIFDYNIDIKIEDEANITYVLSREFDQNLEAILEGRITLRKSGNRTEALGKFDLLEGSTLQFLKTLEAEGSIDFRSGELSNPYLDITATYFNYYYPLSGPDADEEIPVEVRLFIQGPLEDLEKNLSTGEDNIAVYYGAKNIADNTQSHEFDASDAAMFILIDEFNTPNVDQAERNQVASTAAGLAGSVVGGFLNKQFGDAVRSVQLRQVGSSTIISLVGRAGDFRYEIGTSTDVYQDLSRANVKIQYPVTKNLFLRVERKESINRESTYTNEMINEVGIKYLFEF